VTVASATASLATMSRRVGSARAENTRDNESAVTSLLRVINQSVDNTVRRPSVVVNQLVEEGVTRGAHWTPPADRNRSSPRAPDPPIIAENGILEAA
jgi:hypothetical protein